MQGRRGVRISRRLPHQKDGRAAGRQAPRGGVRRGAVGVGTVGVVAAGFPHAAVSVARITMLTRRGGRQRPADRPGVDFGDLSPDLNRAARRHAGGLRGEHLDESWGDGERVGRRHRRITASRWPRPALVPGPGKATVAAYRRQLALMVPWPRETSFCPLRWST